MVYEFELLADYHQFYLQDESAPEEPEPGWTDAEVAAGLSVGPSVIRVGTARNTTVPVAIEVLEAEPAGDATAWDRVNDCAIDLPSGRLVVAGCTDYLPDAARIALRPGAYRARVYYGGLGALSADGLEGEDRYRVALWPAPAAGESGSGSRPVT
jgi:hypothetical protein